MLRILTTVLLVLVGGVTQARTQAQPPRVSADIEELLWWLPLDTETVQVTQTPAKPQGPLFEGIARARGEIDGGDESYGEILTRHLKGTRVKATVDGSRHFTPPSGLGGMLYEGALIVRFERPLGETGTRLMAALGKRALKVDRFDGVEIVEFRDMLESDLWTSYIAMPAADLSGGCDEPALPRGTVAPAKNSNRGASPAREPSGVAMGGCRCAVPGPAPLPTGRTERPYLAVFATQCRGRVR